MIEKHIIKQEDVGKRLDMKVCELQYEIARNYIQKLISNGNITVNNKIVKNGYKLKNRDEISIVIPDAIPLDVEPEDIPIEIIYDDNHLIVVNKPKGMVVHPASGNYSGTLVNALLEKCKGKLSNINGVIRPGIVHRIDKDTTGLLVVAKTNLAHEGLAKQFKEHSIKRRYLALVWGIVKNDSGKIIGDIGRHPKDRKKMTVVSKNGKHAVTHYKVLERFKDATLIEARLETGRTHQIRVHMSYIGHGLIGDEVYCSNKKNKSIQGQLLHAKVIGFIHPVTKKYLEFESENPEHFNQVLEKFRGN